MKPTYVAFQVECEIGIQESPLQSHGILNSLRILLLALELLLEDCLRRKLNSLRILLLALE